MGRLQENASAIGKEDYHTSRGRKRKRVPWRQERERGRHTDTDRISESHAGNDSAMDPKQEAISKKHTRPGLFWQVWFDRLRLVG